MAGIFQERIAGTYHGALQRAKGYRYRSVTAARPVSSI
jgi:hypothetical protein